MHNLAIQQAVPVEGEQVSVVGISLVKMKDVKRGNSYMSNTDFVVTRPMSLEEAEDLMVTLRKIKPPEYLYFIVTVGTLVRNNSL